MRISDKLADVGGWSLSIGEILYWLFYGPVVGGFGLGDDLWMLRLFVDGLSIAAIMLGLVGAHSALRLSGWSSTLWWVSTALALLGLTVANVFFAAAIIGLAVVAFASLQAAWTAATLGIGAALWMYLYVVGVRVGDENARSRTGAEELLGLIATVLMALGIVALGWLAIRRRRDPPRAGEQRGQILD